MSAHICSHEQDRAAPDSCRRQHEPLAAVVACQRVQTCLWFAPVNRLLTVLPWMPVLPCLQLHSMIGWTLEMRRRPEKRTHYAARRDVRQAQVNLCFSWAEADLTKHTILHADTQACDDFIRCKDDVHGDIVIGKSAATSPSQLLEALCCCKALQGAHSCQSLHSHHQWQL